MDLALRPMSTSQILDRTFSLYRRHFFLFAGIALIAPALKLLAGLAQLAIFGSPLAFAQGTFDPRVFEQIIANLLVGVVLGATVYLIGTSIATSATIYAVSMVHLGKTTTITESYAKIRPIFWRILGLIIRVFFLAVWPILVGYALVLLAGFALVGFGRNAGTGAAIFGGLMGLVGFPMIIGAFVWAIISFCRYALAVPACTLEGLPAKVSVIRSKFLSNGRKGSIFLIYLLTGLLTVALGYVLEMPGLLASKAMWFNMHISYATLLWLYVSQFLAGAIAGPIVTIALALMYYDQRVRKEAFDLQLMMEAMGVEQPAQAQTQAAGSGPLPA